MGTFTISHRGTDYEVDADDQTSAQKKLDDHFAVKNKDEDALTKVFRTINEKLGIRSDAAVNPPALSSAVTKGILVLGQMVPQTPNLTDLEQNHPYVNKAANIAGGVGSMLGPAAAVSKLVAGVAPGVMAEAGAQGVLGAGVNVGDKVAEKGTDTTSKDIRNATILGVLGGAAGPLVGRLSSRNFNSARHTDEQLAKLSEEKLHQLMTPAFAKDLAKGSGKEAVSAIMDHPLTQAAAGAFGASHIGMDPMLGALLGGVAKPALGGVTHGLSSATANSLFHNPTNQAILNALIQERKMEAGRN